MTKSISRSQVRLIESTNAIFGAEEACAMLRISRDAMYRLAKDPDDPFPIRYIGGKTRDGIVLHDCGRVVKLLAPRSRLAGAREGVRGRARIVCRLHVHPGALCCGHRFRHGRNHLIECGPIKVTPTRALNFRTVHDIR